MSTIWKYSLNSGRNDLQMPRDAELLTVQLHEDAPVLWVLVWPENELQQRVISLHDTGEPIEAEPGVYIGTVQVSVGLVLHAFDATGLD